MPGWLEYSIIILAVIVAAVYLFRRMRSALKGEDSLDCPFADKCDGCHCQQPELRDKCGVASDDKNRGNS